MEGKKTTLTLLLTLATIISAVSFGWSIGNDRRNDAIVYALHTIFSMYTFLFALLSIKERDVNVHSAGVFHVSVLLTSASLVLLGTSILPTTPSPVAAIPEDTVLSFLWPALTAVYSAAAVVAMTTPIGPPLHYPPSNLYPQKIVDSITNMAENNVAGVVGTSLPSLSRMRAYLRHRCVPVVSITVQLHDQSRLARKPGSVPRHWGSPYPPRGNACQRQLHANARSHGELPVQFLRVETNPWFRLAIRLPVGKAELGSLRHRSTIGGDFCSYLLCASLLFAAVDQVPRTRPL